jgi:Nucleotide-diphospho-sugar transferase
VEGAAAVDISCKEALMLNESCSFAMTRRRSTYYFARDLLTCAVFLCINLLFSSTGAQLVEKRTPTEIGLSKSLAMSAGVYQDSSSNPLLKKTVVITGCNHGYLPFLNNFKCFIDRLNMKVLVFSMDLRTHMHVLHRMNSSMKSFHWVGKNAISEESADFRSEQFNLITHSKTSYTQMVLSLGYDVLFIDLDIALIRDPLPYIIWRNVDYVFTHNKICPQ